MNGDESSIISVRPESTMNSSLTDDKMDVDGHHTGDDADDVEKNDDENSKTGLESDTATAETIAEEEDGEQDDNDACAKEMSDEDKKTLVDSDAASGCVSGREIYRCNRAQWSGEERCATCNNRLRSRQIAKSHMNLKHARELMYKCDLCEYKVRRKDRLTRHVASVHCKEFDLVDNSTSQDSKYEGARKLLKCKYCFFETYTNHLRSHSLTIHRVKWHKCRYCSFSTDKITELGEHVALKHDYLRSFSCPLCDYRTVRWQFLSRHLKFDHRENLERNEISLEKEKKRYMSSSSDPEYFKEIKDNVFICDQCHFTTVNHKNLNRHIIRVHQKNWTVVKREDKVLLEDYKDTKLFSLKEDSNNSSDVPSESSQQSFEKPKFYCNKCDFVTLYESLYHEHLACNHMRVQNIQLFTCDYCPFTSSYSHSVKRHYNTVHIKINVRGNKPTVPREKVFECDFCNILFKKKFLLRRHLNRDHDEYKPFNCTVCDYKSATRPELIRHMRLHV